MVSIVYRPDMRDGFEPSLTIKFTRYFVTPLPPYSWTAQNASCIKPGHVYTTVPYYHMTVLYVFCAGVP